MAFLPVAALVALAVAAPTSAPPPMDSLFAVAWRKSLVEVALLEYKPMEPAGPAVDPVTGMVVAATRDGYVQAFSAEGRELWHFIGRSPYIGAPIVADDLVLVGGIDGRVLALDRSNGEVRWTYQTREEMGT